MPRDIRIFDSITQPADASGAAVVAGSHGGISSGRYAAQIGVTGIVFNDAGVGRDEAGLNSLPYFDDLRCPAATVDHRSARIADGVDMARHGEISHVNETAAELGCSPGQNALECAATMHDAGIEPVREDVASELAEVELEAGPVPVIAVDSIGQIEARHEDAVIIAGSHGERMAGEIETYIPTRIAGITLFDAGVGKDDAGIGRLAAMDDRGIPAGAVDVDTAFIGDAQSAWKDGVLSHVNEHAANIGIQAGDTPRDFADRVREDA